MITNKMNRYCLTFPFKGVYEFVYLNANEMANHMLGDTDDILEFIGDETLEQSFEHTFTRGDESYLVDFAYNDCTKFNVYKINLNDRLEEDLVESDIPYLCIAIEQQQENGTWTPIYKLSDNV